jgi:hypothetical protein
VQQRAGPDAPDRACARIQHGATARVGRVLAVRRRRARRREKKMEGWHRRTAKVLDATQYDTMLRPLYVVSCAEDGWNAEQIACWDQEDGLTRTFDAPRSSRPSNGTR